MEQNLEHTIALLERTPAALNALLRDLPDDWGRSNEGGETWSPFDVVGHLIQADRVNWMRRAKLLIQSGEPRTGAFPSFEAFDRWAHGRETQGKSLAQLLDEFARLRSENLGELRALNPRGEDFERRGSHPALGVVTLSQLLAAWAVHDLTHVHQISRTMAHQYRDAAGPWSRFLGVLQCEGHSPS